MVLSELGTWAVSTIAGGIAGNQAYDKLKDMRQQTRRTFAGTLGAPADHDIDKAVASAAYQAVMVVLKDYEAAAGHRLAQDFVEVLGVALRDRVTLFRDPWTEPEIPTAARPHLNRLISASGDTPEAVADISPFLTDVMLDEVTEIVGGIAVPEAFVASMRANEPNGFFPRFRAFIAQELAINDRFHRLFVATRLAEMADGVDVMRGKMERFAREAAELRDVLGEVQEDVREIKIKMNQAIGNNTIAEQALEMLTREKKQTERAILFFLARVFNENVQPADVVSFLYERADELAARKTEAVLVLAEAPSNSNNEVDALRRAAAEALLNEDFDRNAELLEQVADLEVTNLRRKEANLAEQIQETERSRVRAVESLKARVDAQKLRGDPKATADAVWALFEVEYPTTMPQPERFQVARALQDEWYVRGRDKGLNFDLAVGVELARLTTGLALGPNQSSAARNDLGVALETLGVRESGTARLEEAFNVYRRALAESERERLPHIWAALQNNLGNVLRVLGARDNGSGQLEESVAAYRLALQERTRENVPLDWAMTQSNLGNALQALGEQSSETSLLEQALVAYRLALEEYTRERVPLEWATTQNNLGSALAALGERKGEMTLLEEAVIAYRTALEERTRERVPLDWATTQNNLGTVLSSIGERESGTTRFKEAVSAYCAALEVWTRERAPLEWAMTQNNLGIALRNLGERESKSDTGKLKNAVEAHRAALEERTRERVPMDWAGTQNNLGCALHALGMRERDPARLDEAVTVFRAALEEYTRERVPLDWAMTQNNLGNVLSTIGKRDSCTMQLGVAATAYRAALEEWTPERVPLKCAMANSNLGHTLLFIASLKRELVAAELAFRHLHYAHIFFVAAGQKLLIEQSLFAIQCANAIIRKLKSQA